MAEVEIIAPSVEVEAQTANANSDKQEPPQSTKENTEHTQLNDADAVETTKTKQKTEQTKSGKNKNKRQSRVSGPIKVQPGAEGAVEIQIGSSRPRDAYVESLRSAFAAETKKVVVRAIGAGIINAVYAASELFREGVTEKFSIEADTVLEEGKRHPEPRRTPRVFITLLRSPTWVPQPSSN